MTRPTPRAALALALAVATALPAPAPALAADPAPFAAEAREFRLRREAALRADDGWLTLVDLAWLKPGASAVGSAPGAAVRLPDRAPAAVGTLTLASDDPKAEARFQPAPGAAVRLNGQPFPGGPIRSDADGARADVLAIGDLRLTLLRRNDRFAVRVKDNASPARARFGGCRWYDPDPSWQVVARFAPHPVPKTIKFATIVGGEDVMPSPGTATFERDGRSYTLEAAAEPDGRLWFVFRDATAGTATAANGRQLTADAPIGDVVVLDFNRAINLPCAYVEHATCPIPPDANRLPIPVPAGEKLPAPPRAD